MGHKAHVGMQATKYIKVNELSPHTTRNIHNDTSKQSTIKGNSPKYSAHDVLL
jgi:hypothetical protein